MKREQRCHWCSAPLPHGTRHVAVSYLVQWTEDGNCFDVADAVDCIHWCLECAPKPENVSKVLAAREVSRS